MKLDVLHERTHTHIIYTYIHTWFDTLSIPIIYKWMSFTCASDFQGYSPPPRRSRSRRSNRRDDRRDNRRPDPKKKAIEEKRIPPPAVRGPDKPQITEEQRANSVEFAGHYYAALDFTPPNQGGESSGQKTRIQMPYGWEVADITDDVRDAVVRLHTFGTDFVVGESGKAFHTAKGTRPGALEMIWDFKTLGEMHFIYPNFFSERAD